MRRNRMPDMKEGGVNVTPLIDIVMCMIIFFMLVAKIGVTTGAEEMEIPETVLGKKIEDMGNTLTLNVREGAEDQPLVTALVDGDHRELKLMDMRSGEAYSPMVETLTALRQRNEQFKVIIRGEKDMPYQCLEPVLLACSQANVTNVNFNTKVVER